MKQPDDDSANQILRRAARLQHARKHPALSPLRGLGAFGMIGWSIATPTVAGALIGMWLDEHAPSSFSWPIALILGGLALGGFMAWSWMSRERDDDYESDSENTGSETSESSNSPEDCDK